MRTALVLLAIALLGFGGWWMLEASRGLDTGPRAVAGPDSAAARQAVAPVVADESEQVAVEREAAPPSDATPLVVEVVVRTLDRQTRQPLPAVEVHYDDGTFNYSSMTAADRELMNVDPEQYLRKFGRRVLSDAEGRVVLRARKSLRLMARKDSLFGAGFWSASRPGRPDAALRALAG